MTVSNVYNEMDALPIALPNAGDSHFNPSKELAFGRCRDFRDCN